MTSKLDPCRTEEPEGWSVITSAEALPSQLFRDGVPEGKREVEERTCSITHSKEIFFILLQTKTVLLRTWYDIDDRLIASSSLTAKLMLVFLGRCYSAEGVFSWCFHPGKCFEERLCVFIIVYITIAKSNLACFLHQLCSVIRSAQRGSGLTNCNSSNCCRIQNKERIFRLHETLCFYF